MNNPDTQKNWIWIAAFVTNGADVEGIPKSTQMQRDAHRQASTYLHHGNKLNGDGSISLWAPSPSTLLFSPRLPLSVITLFPS